MYDVQRLVSARSCSEKRCLLGYCERCTCPTENQSVPWGESVDRVLSSFSCEPGQQSGRCWLRNIQLGQLLVFWIVKHPLLTEGNDSTGRLLNACTQSADRPSFLPTVRGMWTSSVSLLLTVSAGVEWVQPSNMYKTNRFCVGTDCLLLCRFLF